MTVMIQNKAADEIEFLNKERIAIKSSLHILKSAIRHEIEQLEYDLGKCREGSAIRTRINDHQVEKIRRLEVERDAWKESRDARVREALNKEQT